MLAPANSTSATQPGSGLSKVLLLAVLLCCIHGRMSFATVTQTQTGSLNYAYLLQPSSGSQTCVILYNQSGNTCNSGTGTFAYGSANPFSATIYCSDCGANNTVTVSSSPTGTGVTSVDQFICNYNNGEKIGPSPLTGLSDPGTGGKTLVCGATATYTSSVNDGESNALSVSLTVNSTNFVDGGGQLSFVKALTLTKNADINFGTVTANNASTYRISTAGAVSTISGTGTPLYGTTSAGNIIVSGSPYIYTNISVGGYTSDNGVTPSNAQCSLNGGAAGSCSTYFAAASQSLLIGVDVTTDGTQAAGTTAAPSFVVTAYYQ